MSEKEKDKQKGKPKQQQQQGGPKKERKPKGPAPEAQQDDGAEETGTPAPPPRLIAAYREKVVPALQQKFGYTNLLAVPRMEKIVISMGLGKAVTSGEKGKMEQAEKELAVIAGQRPVRCKAKKS